jgi:hypothetical protein
MKPRLTVILSTGQDITFDTAPHVNFLQDHLLVTVQVKTDVTGIHWDRFAGMIQATETGGPAAKTPSLCRTLLRFENGDTRSIEIPEFLKSDLTLSRNMIKIIGRQETAVLNLDYFQWYRIISGGTSS